MKTSLRLAIAAAMAVSISGAANAAIDLNAVALVPSASYAAELADGAIFVAGEVVTADLGFATANTQDIFLRYDISNATFASLLTTASNIAGATPAPGATTMVSGGQIGDSCVVYQYTGTGAELSTHETALTLPGLTAATPALDVGITYSVHETAISAGCDTGNNSTNLITPIATTLYEIKTALLVGSTGYTVTSDVNIDYLGEIDTTVAIDTAILELADLTLDIDDGVLHPVTGSALDGDDLVTDWTYTITGNFGALGDTYLSTATCDGTTAADATSSPGVVAADLQSATYVIPATIPGAPLSIVGLLDNPSAAINAYFCYTTNGTDEIEPGTYTARADFVAAAGADLAPAVELPAGEIIQNGTILKAPFAKGGTGGTAAYINLTNTSGQDADYTVACFSRKGNPEVAGTPGTVPANESLRLYMSAVGCPAPVVQGYNSVEITLRSPDNGGVTGTFVRENLSSGLTGFSDMTGNKSK